MGKMKEAAMVCQREYLERNLDVAKIHGIVSGLDAIAARAMKRKGMPLWLFAMLGAEKRRAKDLIAPLVARRDEMENHKADAAAMVWPTAVFLGKG